MSLSYTNIEVVFHFKTIEVTFLISSRWLKIRLHAKNKLLMLPRTNLRSSSIWKKLRLSSIFKNIEVILHISSSWVKIRLHTKNQLPGLPGSVLKVWLGGWWWVGGPTNYFVTHNLYWVWLPYFVYLGQNKVSYQKWAS